MVTGNDNFIEQIKKMMDGEKTIFGMKPKIVFSESMRNGELFCVIDNDNNVIGFIRFHKRKDGITTIYEIYVKPGFRRQGIGRNFIGLLANPIRVKCPVNLDSNGFYNKLGFKMIGQENGKKRILNIWMKGV